MTSDPISNSGPNDTCFPIFTTPFTLVSYKNLFIWSTRIGGTVSMRTCWLASRVTPGRVGEVTCTEDGVEMYWRASRTVCICSRCSDRSGLISFFIIPTKMRRTCMSSCKDRQSSMTTESFCCGARSVERNLPPNIRVIGDSAVLIYRCPHPCINVISTKQLRMKRTHSPRDYHPIPLSDFHPPILLWWFFLLPLFHSPRC